MTPPLTTTPRFHDCRCGAEHPGAQPAPPTEAVRLLTAMVEHHDMMGMTPIMGHSCEAAREARRYLAATEESGT